MPRLVGTQIPEVNIRRVGDVDVGVKLGRQFIRYVLGHSIAAPGVCCTALYRRLKANPPGELLPIARHSALGVRLSGAGVASCLYLVRERGSRLQQPSLLNATRQFEGAPADPDCHDRFRRDTECRNIHVEAMATVANSHRFEVCAVLVGCHLARRHAIDQHVEFERVALTYLPAPPNQRAAEYPLIMKVWGLLRKPEWVLSEWCRDLRGRAIPSPRLRRDACDASTAARAIPVDRIGMDVP